MGPTLILHTESGELPSTQKLARKMVYTDGQIYLVCPTLETGILAMLLQLSSWRAIVLQSLVPTLIKYIWTS